MEEGGPPPPPPPAAGSWRGWGWRDPRSTPVGEGSGSHPAIPVGRKQSIILKQQTKQKINK